MRARLSRLAAREDGFTLVELIAVMGIFMTIVGGLTALFVSGARAELDANERFQAQQSARIALDRVRRELHCSSGLTKTDGTALSAGQAVTAVRVTLLSHCPTAGGIAVSVDYQMVASATGRWRLERVKGGSTERLADSFTNDDVFTYTPQSPASRATLHVDLPVNVDSNEGSPTWRLIDDIVLRNTLRQAP
jgi:Tfp pilus assembly protein PilW